MKKQIQQLFFLLTVVVVVVVFSSFAYALTKSAHLVAASSQSLTRADDATLDIVGDLTIEGWIRIASAFTNGFLVSKWGDGVSWDRAAYELAIDSSGNFLKLSIAGSGATDPNPATVSVSWTPTLNTWYHVAVVYTASAGSAAFYVDGVQQGTTQTGLDTAINNVTLPFAIGANHNSSDVPANFFDGDISLVRVWKEARTVTQISDNKCSVLGATTNLQGEWKLDDVLTDNSGNANTLTNNNTVTFTTALPSCFVATAASSIESDLIIFE